MNTASSEMQGGESFGLLRKRLSCRKLRPTRFGTNNPQADGGARCLAVGFGIALIAALAAASENEEIAPKPGRHAAGL